MVRVYQAEGMALRVLEKGRPKKSSDIIQAQEGGPAGGQQGWGGFKVGPVFNRHFKKIPSVKEGLEKRAGMCGPICVVGHFKLHRVRTKLNNFSEQTAKCATHRRDLGQGGYYFLCCPLKRINFERLMIEPVDRIFVIPRGIHFIQKGGKFGQVGVDVCQQFGIFGWSV